MTRHEANSMKQTTPISDEVWYIDSGPSNHMTSHKEWFSYLEKPTQPGVVATGDDTPHLIAERETFERVARPDNQEELGLGRADR